MTDEDAPTQPGSSRSIAALDEAAAGTLIGDRYRLDKRIGSGGMGSVWRAHDLRLQRDIALKLVALAQPLARMRFIREGKVAARLDHPGLCRVYDVGERRGIGHLVMELLDGETLYHRMLRANPPLTWRLDLMAEVARAMAAAHAQSLVHRDLKPDNIFLDKTSGAERAVVIDFGLAFLDGADQGELGRLTQSDITGGTPLYMAPEQARALAIGAPADVYALGCVLFELLAGRPPFEGAPAAVMSRQVFATPPTVAELVDVDPAVSTLVSDMLAKLPEQRPTMTEAATRLDALSAAAAQPRRPRTSSPGLRVHRALTRNLEAASALPVAPAIGAVVAVGPVPDDILVAIAAAGMSARRAATVDAAAALARGEPRTVVLADATDETVQALCALGAPVIAVADVGALDQAARLARLGCADVVTRPIQPAVATRKILRALRRLPPSPPP
ncbi:MAG TPA: serine/threonine-protein kinase [Kofleriaceae bacterium]|nr:serine/threonine-protein kinase [Kofleriaceae bacterium]